VLSWRDSSVKCPVGSEHVRIPGIDIDRLDRAGISDTPFFGPFPSPCVADHDEVNNRSTATHFARLVHRAS